MDIETYYAWDANEDFKLLQAGLSSSDGNLKWSTSLRSFESVHGLSRILKLVPDKLATAEVKKFCFS